MRPLIRIAFYFIFLGIFLFNQYESHLSDFFDLKHEENDLGHDVYCSPVSRFGKDFQNTVKRAEMQGFKCQCHTIVTLDGYIIEIHRIGSFKGPPVLFLHGFLSTSEQWLGRTRTEDLPSLVADKGFDVWLGNYRGNSYGRNHTVLSPDDPSTKHHFWNFSLHEVGYYDLPSTVDYICKVTGRDRISFVGYSVGVSVFLITASTRPEYNDKFNMAVLLAPFVYSCPSEQKVLSIVNNFHLHHTVKGRFHDSPPEEFMPRAKSRIKFFKRNCNPHSLAYFSCVRFMTSSFGPGDMQHINQESLYKLLSAFMAGTSNKLLDHLGQMVETGNFENYRRGTNYLNEPGEPYPLSVISVPMSIHSSIADTISDPPSNDILVKKLNERSLVGRYLIMEEYTHLDYFLSKNAQKDIFPDMIDLLCKVEDNQEVNN